MRVATADAFGPPRLTTVVVAFVIAFVCLGLTMDRDLNVFDEGIVLSDAMRVAAGDVVHRDFYSPYGPGTYYVVAALFQLSAAKFIAARSYGLTVMASIATMTFLAAGGVRWPIAVIAAVACVLLEIELPAYLYPMFPCLALGMLGSLLLARPDAPFRPRMLLGAGVCTGLAGYFRYDAGFFLLLSHIAGIAALLALDGGSHLPRALLRAASVYILGTSLAFLPGLLAYLATAPPSAFIADIVTYPIAYYTSMRGLPFPDVAAVQENPELLNVYLPIVACGFGVLLIRGEWRRSIAGEREALARLIIFGTLAMGLFYKGVVRVSTIHMLMSIVPSLVVLAICADAWWSLGSRKRSLTVSFLQALCPAGFGAWRQFELLAAEPTRSVGGALLVRSGLADGDNDPLAGCTATAAIRGARLPYAYASTAHYLRQNAAPGERIWVGLARHDKTYANSPGMYFLSDRLPATHWHQFDPGLQTRADIQARMVDELRAQHVRWVVRDASYEGSNEPNASSIRSGAHLLDDYIDAHYRRVASQGPVSLWLVADAPEPASPRPGDTACLPGR